MVLGTSVIDAIAGVAATMCDAGCSVDDSDSCYSDGCLKKSTTVEMRMYGVSCEG